MAEGRAVSIGALLTSGVALRPHEAVAVVAALCSGLGKARTAPGVMPAISASTVTIDADGAVAVAGGPPVEDEQTVSLAGRLLLEMLDRSAASVDAAVPPRLRSTALRAASAGRGAFETAAAFVLALQRHGPEYGQAQAVRALFERWASVNSGVPEAPPTTADRRGNASASDVLRRFLREADQEVYRARVEASSRSAPRGAAVRPSGIRSPRLRRALVVGATLIVLAGAGLMLLVRGAADDLPFVAPITRPTPVVPRREPGRELLRRTQRVSTVAPARTAPTRRAGAQDPHELTMPQTETRGR